MRLLFREAFMAFRRAPLLSALSITTIGFSLYAVYMRVVSGTVPIGFTANLVVMTFLSGVQLLFLGIIGEYLGRVYGEAKGRPTYVVAEVVGSD